MFIRFLYPILGVLCALLLAACHADRLDTQPTGRPHAPLSSEQYACHAGLGPEPGPPSGREHNTEQYDLIEEQPFISTADPGGDISTFSVDVDTASYSNLRRFLRAGRRPPRDAVRIEELINYFPYAYAAPPAASATPFATHLAVTACPWNGEHLLARIALQGERLAIEERPPVDLVFLIDVSGSMGAANKLPLLKRSLIMLSEHLTAEDRIALTVYAGAAGLVLPPTPGDEQETIRGALERLEAGGSTAGAAGIRLAYATAREMRAEGRQTRVLLATDGDFNVGVTDRAALRELVAAGAGDGVYLSILGFGMGNYHDGRMESLSNRGNGNYAYIDTLAEARKCLVEQLAGTCLTIAEDVKLQVCWNPARVGAWRLVGYENRRLRAQDFADDARDAGEIGPGHAVTALYELVPAAAAGGSKVEPNPYTEPTAPRGEPSIDWFELRLRHKAPGADASTLSKRVCALEPVALDAADADLRWAVAVAGFGLLLRESAHAGDLDWERLAALARDAAGDDPDPYRSECLELIETARELYD